MSKQYKSTRPLYVLYLLAFLFNSFIFFGAFDGDIRIVASMLPFMLMYLFVTAFLLMDTNYNIKKEAQLRR